MKKHSLKDWLIAVRPWSFPASAMPVIVTLAYLYWAYGVIEWANGLLALAGIVIFHASGNAWSDYFDFERGVDRVDTFGVKTLTSGQFMPLEIRNLAIGLMVPAVMVGLWLVVRTGLSHLYITQLITRQNFNVPQYVPPYGVNNILVTIAISFLFDLSH